MPTTSARPQQVMQLYFVTGAGAAAGLAVVKGLLHRQWLYAVVCACILVLAIAMTRGMSEPTATFRDHAATLFAPPVCSPGSSRSSPQRASPFLPTVKPPSQ
jgi:uncharacterized membrane protein YfcA